MITLPQKIYWDQAADAASQLAGFRYLCYVDDAPQMLTDAGCDSSGVGLFPCSASLPPISVGLHRVELATEDIYGLQSARSAAVFVNVVLAKMPAAVRGTSAADTTSDPGTTSDGIRLMVETVAIGLTAPSAIAATPDGRVFVAERAGDILVWEGGHVLSTPALQLGDVAQTSDIGLVALTLHPEFPTNGLVFVAYTARDEKGGFVNRIVRLRDVNSVFGQSAVILEDPVLVAPLRPPRIRVGPDHAVYVAFPANDPSTAESFASYAGKILRINEDGTTPRDNPGSTPIVSSDEAVMGGLAWQPATGRLWLAGRDWAGRDFVRDFLSGMAASRTLDSPVDPSGMAFYAHSRISGFANDLFIGALSGRHLRRVRFSRTDPSHIEGTERLLDGQYGRISDVVVGPDGALYISTSNAGTTSAAADDDRLLKLTSP